MLYSNSNSFNELVEKITVTNTGNYYLTIHFNNNRKPNAEVVMNESELIALKRSVDAALKKTRPITEISVEKMIKLFKFEEPHSISFQYRRDEFRNDEPILKQLLSEKKIIQVSKNSKEIIYKYVGD